MGEGVGLKVGVGGSVGPLRGGVSNRGWGARLGPVGVTGGWGAIEWLFAVGFYMLAAVVALILAVALAAVIGLILLVAGLVHVARGSRRHGLALIVAGALLGAGGAWGTRWFWVEFSKQRSREASQQAASDLAQLRSSGVRARSVPGRHIDVEKAAASATGARHCVTTAAPAGSPSPHATLCATPFPEPAGSGPPMCTERPIPSESNSRTRIWYGCRGR
jgi:hypothetical protein